MKVIHCCLSSFYIDGYSYQENELIREHVKMGHEVLVLASTESFDKSQHKTYVEPGAYIGEEGAKVVRLPFASWLPFSIMKKIKAYKGVLECLESFQPDVVMFHGISAYALLTVAKFKKQNPNLILYADNHADKNNSGRSIVSKYLLHKLFYKWVIKQALPQIKKVLCISIESKRFCSEVYGIANTRLEFFPLGGHVFHDEQYFSMRNNARQELGLAEEDILFLQTGKFDKKKKLADSLGAFLQTKSQRLKFYLAGSFLDDVGREVLPLIERDERIVFLGWKSADSLKSLLCAADVYVQPGSQSATMQMSLCARCPVILDDVESHRVFVDGNGWLVKNNAELKKVFLDIENDPGLLSEMSDKSYQIAGDMLDYKKLALKILS